MITIHLDDSFTRYTCGYDAVQVDASTPAEGLQELFNRYPALYAFLLEGNQLSGLLVVLNDELVLEADDLQILTLQPEDELHLVGLVPCGEYGAIGAVIINGVAGAGTVTAASMAAVAVGVVVMTAVQVAMSVLVGALVGDMEMPDVYSGSLDNSASYTFEGIKNTTAAGTPVPLVYGTHRVGGHVLAIFTESDDTDTAAAMDKNTKTVVTDTYLYAQYGVSEGEVEAISDVMVNRFPISFYAAVHTAPDPSYVRYGATTQEVMPSFNRSMETISISRKITQASPPLGAIPVVYASSEPMYGYIGSNWKKASGKHIGLYTPQPYYVD